MASVAIPHAKVAELLVLAGADVNAQDNEGVTCLAMCDDTDQGPDRILRTKVDSLLASMWDVSGSRDQNDKKQKNKGTSTGSLNTNTYI